MLSAAIVKQMFNFTYQDLAFHAIDSKSLRRFMHIDNADTEFNKSVPRITIKSLSPQTWEAINTELVHYIQPGRKDRNVPQVHIACTRLESNVHASTDFSLLFDAVCVLTQLLYNLGLGPVGQKPV